VGAATLVATPAAAGPPTCGATLTVSTTLPADLTCAGDGLRLAAGVNLNLGGHTLSGSGTGTGVGVSNEGTVTIRNGTLAHWGAAVKTVAVGEPDAGNGPLLVSRVTVQDSVQGLDASGESSTGLYVKPTTVDRSTFLRNDLGISTNWFGKAKVDRSTFIENRVGLFDGGEVEVVSSKFVRNTYGFAATEAIGRVERSTFIDNTTGVRLDNVGNVPIVESTFTGSDIAVDARGWAVDVAGSTFLSNTTAVSVGEYGGSVVRSAFRQNGTTILLPELAMGPTLVQDNTFRRNTDGLYVVAGDPSIQIGGNDARHNTGWGMHVPGSTDLGGNTARNNGNDPQCVGIVCAS
jgi:hypothetical protein